MNRVDFVVTFEVKGANPNGDPDAGNLPRTDLETGHGIVSDVCLKRKIRNNVQLFYGDVPPYRIYFSEGVVLNDLHKEAWLSINEKPSDKLPKDLSKAKQLTDFMCANFFDVRTFGAMMATGVNCGQVRGPVQVSQARSLDPIVSQSHCITRQSVTNEKDTEKAKTMGNKTNVPYGLYQFQGSISGPLAEQRGFSEKDKEIFFEALKNMFENDSSAARPPGSMNMCNIVVFEHSSEFGDAHASQLTDLVKISKKQDVEYPRSLEDYTFSFDGKSVPEVVQAKVHEFKKFGNP